MFLVSTRNFPPELGGMQNLMEGLSNALLMEVLPSLMLVVEWVGHGVQLVELEATSLYVLATQITYLMKHKKLQKNMEQYVRLIFLVTIKI